MGQEIATLQCRLAETNGYAPLNTWWRSNWLDLTRFGERAAVIKRWIRDERLRTIMIDLMTQNNGKVGEEAL